MPGRRIYILFLLSVVLAGILGRQPLTIQPSGNGCPTASVITQHSSSQEREAIHCFVHSLIAPEVISEVLSPTLHLICKHHTTQHLFFRPRPHTFDSDHYHTVNLHPNSVDYYVFSLGKILI